MSLLLLLGGGVGAASPPTDGELFAGLGDIRLIFEVSESQPFAETQVWHDFTGYLHRSGGIDITRGRSSEFDEVQAGTLTTTLDATSGDLDPRNGSSPVIDCLKPRRQCRLRAVWDSITYPIFYGFTHGFPRIYERPLVQGLVPFKATDAFRILGTTDPSTGLFKFNDASFGRFGVGRFGGSTAADQYSGELISAILGSLGWPADLRDLATGRVLVDGEVATGRALSAVDDANRAEGGYLYVARDGKVTFRDRLARYIDTRSTVAQATFSPSAASPPSYTEPFRIEYDDTRFINVARYTGTSGTPQTKRDQTSVDEFGIGEDEQTLISINDADAEGLAALRVSDNATPEDRIEQVVVRVHANKSSHFPAVLALELFDRVDVVVASTYGAADETMASVLQGLNHEITETSWQSTLKLGPYRARQFFTFNDSTLGKFAGSGVFAP